MKKIITQIKDLFTNEDGATAVEYGLLIALIAAGIIVVVGYVGGDVKQAFTDVHDGMNPANPEG